MATREAVEGVSGRLRMALDQESFAPGEVLRGVVKLGMLELIEAREPLAVVVQGKEMLSWDEGRDSPVTNAFDQIFLQQKVELSTSAMYEAGEWEYQFELPLPLHLPSSFELLDIYTEAVDRLRVQITYQATVWLRSSSDVVGYLTAAQAFAVHELSTITPPARALEVSASEAVHWLHCIKRGELQLVVTIPKDVYVSGEVVPLQCCVDTTACKTSITSVAVALVEDVVMRNLGDRPDWTLSRVLSTEHFAGLQAGCVRTQATRVELVENEKRSPVNPDVDAHFVQCSHRVIVQCKPWFAQSVVSTAGRESP
ncbi:unnamed protein product [Hyaloperonospora brassicae]|uniref:Arrestin-like N-terminal domain-containing protein n=1 Tax=Hyaloperonospora brassicae TaxID=162125 RepID=A0AAV0SX20_HYABA|nr:unnamed protein product [Hyaloperonospora brassicae]